ncbi:PREDICTED: uncharacterized protein LOC106333302 [Brassica oleracea var. oleracea]|uniref:uncharacterized protein LOC106333302 n=1 Tax=Brassica oleracea var. oleracea TaxID=109376 RepID=UPI0006A6B958|nr:PREDICTED: uncharacterized protein LOC106333302 [Brassica oleracea var. oleracea]
MRAIPSTFHLCLKFPTPRGVETIQGDRRMSQKRKLTLDENAPERDSEVFWQSQKAKALEGKREPTCKPVISICLDESSPERFGANLREPLKTELIACLKKNLNAVAWAAEDMPGIDIGITCHELNIDPTYKPVKQKRGKLGPERATAIMMNPDDREKTAFITDRGTYCYKVMPFSLKNAGATYQRLVNRIFSEQLGKTMEVYIDDMLVKSLDEHDHISHLEECFAKLNAHNMNAQSESVGTTCKMGNRTKRILHVDGSSSKQGSGIGIRLTSPTGEVLEQSFRLEFHASNNEAEYEALVAGLRLVHGLKIRNIHACCDSQLVANQYSGEYEVRDERMDAYLNPIQDLSRDFNHFALTRIPRSEKTQADALAALASSSDS